MAFAAADLVLGPSARTTITGPDGSQIIKDDYASAINSNLVLTVPPQALLHYSSVPLISSFYPYYGRYLPLVHY
ncbi:hypothetical protein BDFB_011594 [Asbolus verrucosus]|uniref:Uncharacterized protein n=1 Tax=Asbolus verrucosus TaxID=1661398 RepID=A0A482VLV0_ASBVE|nr:hypothetical protein BDFB_011594 [Asbolus verrucosus]